MLIFLLIPIFAQMQDVGVRFRDPTGPINPKTLSQYSQDYPELKDYNLFLLKNSKVVSSQPSALSQEDLLQHESKALHLPDGTLLFAKTKSGHWIDINHLLKIQKGS